MCIIGWIIYTVYIIGWTVCIIGWISYAISTASAIRIVLFAKFLLFLARTENVFRISSEASLSVRTKCSFGDFLRFELDLKLYFLSTIYSYKIFEIFSILKRDLSFGVLRTRYINTHFSIRNGTSDRFKNLIMHIFFR